jgi:glycosyltransferase involved in cell wall biosynthesis
MTYLWSAAGVDRVISVKANYLADVLGHDVTIVTTDQLGREPFFPLSPKVRLIDLGVDYTLHYSSRFARIYSAMRRRRQHRRRLAKVLEELQPDVSIAVGRRDLPVLYSIKAGGVKIAERHKNKNSRRYEYATSLPDLFYRWLTRNENRWARKYDRFVVLNEAERRKWPDKSNISVIPNPITIQPCNAELNHNQVLAVGRICYEKGYDRLLQAWAIVEKRHPDWILSIVGSADDLAERRKLGEMIDRLQLHAAQFVPPTSDIVVHYKTGSILALSSRYEAMPMSVIEAMSCGIPCVAFDCDSGPSEIISNGVDGILVPQGDVQGLADGICRLIDDTELRRQMGEKARRKVEKYSQNSIMTRWERLFERLLND